MSSPKRTRNRTRGRKPSAIPELSREQRIAAEKSLGHAFADHRRLARALTHSSAVPGTPGASNERLEFLGDRVLGLVVAERLFRRYETEAEGGLAVRLNRLVRREACAEAARKAGLGALLMLDEAEERSGGREKESILADVCEAVIAALYLDGGFDVARAFIEKYWAEAFKTLGAEPKDAKSRLQEYALSIGRPVPVYHVIHREGPDHQPIFTIEVQVEGYDPERAKAGSKQEAEREAAISLLRAIGVDEQ
jgi:ribonuclease III